MMTWEDFKSCSSNMSYVPGDTPSGWKPHIIPAPKGRWFAKRVGDKAGAFGDSPSLALQVLITEFDARTGDSVINPCRHNPLGLHPECECLTSCYLPLREGSL